MILLVSERTNFWRSTTLGLFVRYLVLLPEPLPSRENTFLMTPHDLGNMFRGSDFLTKFRVSTRRSTLRKHFQCSKYTRLLFGPICDLSYSYNIVTVFYCYIDYFFDYKL